jgi:hypothetical protein
MKADDDDGGGDSGDNTANIKDALIPVSGSIISSSYSKEKKKTTNSY